MEKEDRKKPLEIPTNASDRNDYIQGIGKKEVLIIGIALVIGIMIAIFGYLTTENPMISMGTAIFILVMGIALVIRDQNNESFVDKMRFMLRYYKMQKQYFYSQYPLYENEKIVQETIHGTGTDSE